MEQRRRQIVDLVNKEGMVKFSRLKSAFPEVSEMTLRTDLKYLDESRQLVRVFGGAKSVTYVAGTDDFVSRRAERSRNEKICIAQKAVGLLRPNDVIFVDSGTTTTEFARHIPNEEFILFTTGIDCLRELSQLTRPRVYILGGRFNPASMCVTGTQPLLNLERLHFDVAFLGTTSYNRQMGFSCGSEEDSTIKRVVLEHAEKTVILMDSTKNGLASTFSFANLSQVHAVITDDGIDSEFVKDCKNLGVKVI